MGREPWAPRRAAGVAPGIRSEPIDEPELLDAALRAVATRMARVHVAAAAWRRASRLPRAPRCARGASSSQRIASRWCPHRGDGSRPRRRTRVAPAARVRWTWWRRQRGRVGAALTSDERFTRGARVCSRSRPNARDALEHVLAAPARVARASTSAARSPRRRPRRNARCSSLGAERVVPREPVGRERLRASSGSRRAGRDLYDRAVDDGRSPGSRARRDGRGARAELGRNLGGDAMKTKTAARRRAAKTKAARVADACRDSDAERAAAPAAAHAPAARPRRRDARDRADS